MLHEVVSVFDTLIPFQYSEQDRRAGYFFGKDRRGQLHRVPLMTVSIGVVTNERRRFTHAAQVSALATEMKSYAKTLAWLGLLDRPAYRRAAAARHGRRRVGGRDRIGVRHGGEVNVSCPECRSVFRVDPAKVPASRRSRAVLRLRWRDHGRHWHAGGRRVRAVARERTGGARVARSAGGDARVRGAHRSVLRDAFGAAATAAARHRSGPCGATGRRASRRHAADGGAANDCRTGAGPTDVAAAAPTTAAAVARAVVHAGASAVAHTADQHRDAGSAGRRRRVVDGADTADASRDFPAATNRAHATAFVGSGSDAARRGAGCSSDDAARFRRCRRGAARDRPRRLRRQPRRCRGHRLRDRRAGRRCPRHQRGRRRPRRRR